MRNVPLGVGSRESPIRIRTPRPGVVLPVKGSPSSDDDDTMSSALEAPFAECSPLPFSVVERSVVEGVGDEASTKARVCEARARSPRATNQERKRPICDVVVCDVVRAKGGNTTEVWYALK